MNIADVEVEILLPFPVSDNAYYSKNRYAQYLSKRGRAFADAVEKAVAEQGCALRIDYKVIAEVYLFPPDKRVRDITNYMKSLMDSLTKAKVWTDDQILDQVFIYRGQNVRKGLCVIRINEAGPLIPAPRFADSFA